MKYNTIKYNRHTTCDACGCRIYDNDDCYEENSCILCINCGNKEADADEEELHN